MLYVGCSGWQYRDWCGSLYPDRLPNDRWLAHYATAFPVVEINSTFYRLPQPKAVRRWANDTPAEFVVRYQGEPVPSHVHRLRDPADPLRRLCESLRYLGDKLGPVLLQLPPNLIVNAGRLDRALSEMPAGSQVAVEPRHKAWFNDDIREILTSHGAALCDTDRKSRLLSPLWVTAGWGYVRLHEGTAHPVPLLRRRSPPPLGGADQRYVGQVGGVRLLQQRPTSLCAR